MRFISRHAFVLLALCLFTKSASAVEVGEQLERTGDEIMVCGQLFHTTAPVVLWLDPGGYDAYRTDRRFGPIEKASWRVFFLCPLPSDHAQELCRLYLVRG